MIPRIGELIAYKALIVGEWDTFAKLLLQIFKNHCFITHKLKHSPVVVHDDQCVWQP